MHILHLYKDYFPVLGGIENYIKVLAEGHAALGHKVTVLVCSPGPETSITRLNGVNIVKAARLFTAASMPISIVQPLILMHQQPDIVHLHAPYPLGETTNWLWRRARATVMTYHSDIVRQKTLLRFYSPLLRRVLQATDRIITTSPNYGHTSPWLTPVLDKCVTVPIGVDIRRFTPGAFLRPEQPTLLFVGRLRYYKGLDTLIRAMPQISEANLLIIGDGPMRSEWETLTHTLGVSDRIIFVGEVEDEDLPDWYRRGNIFVLPASARAEAFGMVLTEAMASGLPCVTTEVGSGTSWVVQNGKTGFVVPPEEPAALAEAINKLIDDESLLDRFGKAGRQRAETVLSQEAMIMSVLDVYKSVLKN